MSKKKIAVLGHFALENMSFNGQTIKTRILADEMERQLPEYEIVRIDTCGYSKKAPVITAKIISAFSDCEDIVILLSRNGRRVLFPVIYYINKVAKRRVWHNVIGAASFELVKKYPKWIKYMNSFEANFVELNKLAANLESVGVKNAVVLPNFKKLEILDPAACRRSGEEPFKLCTFSRVESMKGIEDAIASVREINKDRVRVTLDIFGQIEKGQEQWFEDLMKDQPEYINYKGIVAYEESVSVLRDYYLLLFPSRYTTEGFPGTIIDAYAAGLPVIASMNCELVDHRVTGWIYEGSDPAKQTEYILEAIEDTEKTEAMRTNCTERAKLYQPEIVVLNMLKEMGLK